MGMGLPEKELQKQVQTEWSAPIGVGESRVAIVDVEIPVTVGPFPLSLFFSSFQMWLCSRSVAQHFSSPIDDVPLALRYTHCAHSLFFQHFPLYLFFSFLLPFRFFFGMLLVSHHTHSNTVALKKEVLNLDDRKDQRMLQMSICLKCFLTIFSCSM